MKAFLLTGLLTVVSQMFLSAAPCLPGTLQSYSLLGATGCQTGAITFTNFGLVPGQAFASVINPALVQITPDGTAFSPTLTVSLNQTASALSLFESIFRFNVSGPLTGATVSLISPAATGDGAVTAVMDVCRNGMFPGLSPVGCTGTPASAVALATNGLNMLSDGVVTPVSGFFDVFVDLTADGGLAGSSALRSASVGFSAVPEPSTIGIVAAGLAFTLLHKRRRGQTSRREV